MNKELFVSSTPHETKVGLVEDDLLAEIYLERENEYTLAGSIYKGRVTRVLPGMQSAFVDIGLERDAFLYVSDFMELEEHDDDLTDVVPATRSVPDLRPPARPNRIDSWPEDAHSPGCGVWKTPSPIEGIRRRRQHQRGVSRSLAAANRAGARQCRRFRAEPRPRKLPWPPPPPWRTPRRTKRWPRRGRERGPDRGSDRSPTEAPNAPANAASLEHALMLRARRAEPVRPDSSRCQPSGPPPGYQPIILPGESISKYQRYAQQPPAPEPPRRQARR